MSNIKILIVSIEMKENQRFELSKNIVEYSNKENELLRHRYTVEDMINVLQEDVSNQQEGAISEDKYKNNYHELFEFSRQLDVSNKDLI